MVGCQGLTMVHKKLLYRVQEFLDFLKILVLKLEVSTQIRYMLELVMFFKFIKDSAVDK